MRIPKLRVIGEIEEGGKRKESTCLHAFSFFLLHRSSSCECSQALSPLIDNARKPRTCDRSWSYSTAPSSLVAPRSSRASLERAAQPIAGEDSRRRTSARENGWEGGRRGCARTGMSFEFLAPFDVPRQVPSGPNSIVNSSHCLSSHWASSRSGMDTANNGVSESVYRMFHESPTSL